MELVSIAKIRQNGGTQSRAAMNDQTKQDYADAMREGVQFPPVVVFYDGSGYWLADGFHRVAAAIAIGKTEIQSDVKQGTLRDAILHSLGANATHGLPRSNADKRRAIRVMLDDDEWKQWSDREIARRVGVNDKTVASVRKELSDSGAEIPHLRKGADGKAYPVAAANPPPQTEKLSDIYAEFRQNIGLNDKHVMFMTGIQHNAFYAAGVDQAVLLKIFNYPSWVGKSSEGLVVMGVHIDSEELKDLAERAGYQFKLWHTSRLPTRLFQPLYKVLKTCDVNTPDVEKPKWNVGDKVTTRTGREGTITKTNGRGVYVESGNLSSWHYENHVTPVSDVLDERTAPQLSIGDVNSNALLLVRWFFSQHKDHDLLEIKDALAATRNFCDSVEQAINNSAMQHYIEKVVQ